MQKRRIYAPLPIIHADWSIDNFNGIEFIGSNISFKDETTKAILINRNI
jgi:hypothetical protein